MLLSERLSQCDFNSVTLPLLESVQILLQTFFTPTFWKLGNRRPSSSSFLSLSVLLSIPLFDLSPHLGDKCDQWNVAFALPFPR